MNNTKLRFGAILLILSLVLVACGGSAEETVEEPAVEEAPAETLAAPATTSPPPEKLVIWAEEKIATALDPLVGAYESAAGVDVEVVIYDFGAIKNDVLTAGPAGEGPDLFVGPHDMVGEIVANGVVAPLDLGSIAEDIFDVGIAGFSYNGEVYGFPYATEAIAMYYNADLIDGVPSTWDNVKAACDEAGTELCVGAPGGGGGGDAYHNHPFFASDGGYIFKFDGGFDPSDVGLDNASALASAEYLDSLVKNGTVASTDYSASMTAFQEGRSLFWMTGPWARNDAAAVNYATVEVQAAMYAEDPRLPATKSLFAVVEAEDPIAAQFAASASNGIPMPNIPEMGNVWGPVGDAMLIIRDQNYGTNEETGVTVNSASDAMKLAAQQVRDAIAGG